MTKLLVPVDGSELALHAVDYAARRAAIGGIEIDLLNVQPALPMGVTTAVGSSAVHNYHREEAAKALSPAEARLTEAGITFTAHTAVGTPGDVIAAHAKDAHCDEIVMGARGHGALLSLLLGSTATKVLALTNVPVTLVK